MHLKNPYVEQFLSSVALKDLHQYCHLAAHCDYSCPFGQNCVKQLSYGSNSESITLFSICTTLPLVGSWTTTSSGKRGSQTTFSCCPIVVRFLWLKIKLIAYKARNMRRHEKGFCCYTIQQLDIILGSISISVTLRKSSAAQMILLLLT